MGVWPYFLGVSGYEQEAVGGARNKVNKSFKSVISKLFSCHGGPANLHVFDHGPHLKICSRAPQKKRFELQSLICFEKYIFKGLANYLKIAVLQAHGTLSACISAIFNS